MKNEKNLNSWIGVIEEKSAHRYRLTTNGDYIMISTAGSDNMKLVVLCKPPKKKICVGFVSANFEADIQEYDIITERFKIIMNYGANLIALEACTDQVSIGLLAYSNDTVVLGDDTTIHGRAQNLFFLERVPNIEESMRPPAKNSGSEQYLSRNFYFQTNGNDPDKALITLDKSFPIKMRETFPNEYVLCAEYTYYLLLMDLIRTYTVNYSSIAADLLKDSTNVPAYKYVDERSKRIDLMRKKLYHGLTSDMVKRPHPISQDVWDSYVQYVETQACKKLEANVEKFSKTNNMGDFAKKFVPPFLDFFFHASIDTYQKKMMEIKIVFGITWSVC